MPKNGPPRKGKQQYPCTLSSEQIVVTLTTTSKFHVLPFRRRFDIAPLSLRVEPFHRRRRICRDIQNTSGDHKKATNVVFYPRQIGIP